MKIKARRKRGNPFPWGFFVFIALVLFAASFFHGYYKEKQRRTPAKKAVPVKHVSTKAARTPAAAPDGPATAPPPTPIDEPAGRKAPPPTPVEPSVALVRPKLPRLADRAPRIAIIVDDFGNNLPLGEEFVKLPGALGVAVLPGLPHSRRLAEKAASSGKTVLLHLPMEPRSGVNPGPGTLRTAMSPEEIRTVLRKDLESVPNAEGLNNHEGSKATADGRVMETVIGYAKARSLFFVDSVTTGASQGRAVARRLGLPYAARDVFLDNEDDAAYVKKRLDLLVEEAKKKGSAVGICHVRRATLTALQEYLPTLEKEGVTLVTIKSLLH